MIVISNLHSGTKLSGWLSTGRDASRYRYIANEYISNATCVMQHACAQKLLLRDPTVYSCLSFIKEISL